MGRGISKELMSHCCCEMLHAQWEILLDDEFLEPYEHGIIVKAVMGLHANFTFASSPIQLIIPRSMHLFATCF
jgi:hypothetical protein